MEEWPKTWLFKNLNLIGVIISEDNECYDITIRIIVKWKGDKRVYEVRL